MDDYRLIAAEALERQRQQEDQEIKERAVKGVMLVMGMADVDVDSVVDREVVRNLFAALYAPMKSLHSDEGLEAVYTALIAVYYLGYKAGQEAQAQASADDTNGVDWSGEVR
jgi:hypothetical protein